MKAKFSKYLINLTVLLFGVLLLPLVVINSATVQNLISRANPCETDEGCLTKTEENQTTEPAAPNGEPAATPTPQISPPAPQPIDDLGKAYEDARQNALSQCKVIDANCTAQSEVAAREAADKKQADLKKLADQKENLAQEFAKASNAYGPITSEQCKNPTPQINEACKYLSVVSFEKANSYDAAVNEFVNSHPLSDNDNIKLAAREQQAKIYALLKTGQYSLLSVTEDSGEKSYKVINFDREKGIFIVADGSCPDDKPCTKQIKIADLNNTDVDQAKTQQAGRTVYVAQKFPPAVDFAIKNLFTYANFNESDLLAAGKPNGSAQSDLFGLALGQERNFRLAGMKATIANVDRQKNTIGVTITDQNGKPYTSTYSLLSMPDPLKYTEAQYQEYTASIQDAVDYLNGKGAEEGVPGGQIQKLVNGEKLPVVTKTGATVTLALENGKLTGTVNGQAVNNLSLNKISLPPALAFAYTQKQLGEIAGSKNILENLPGLSLNQAEKAKDLMQAWSCSQNREACSDDPYIKKNFGSVEDFIRDTLQDNKGNWNYKSGYVSTGDNNTFYQVSFNPSTGVKLDITNENPNPGKKNYGSIEVDTTSAFLSLNNLVVTKIFRDEFKNPDSLTNKIYRYASGKDIVDLELTGIDSALANAKDEKQKELLSKQKSLLNDIKSAIANKTELKLEDGTKLTFNSDGSYLLEKGGVFLATGAKTAVPTQTQTALPTLTAERPETQTVTVATLTPTPEPQSTSVGCEQSNSCIDPNNLRNLFQQTPRPTLPKIKPAPLREGPPEMGPTNEEFLLSVALKIANELPSKFFDYSSREDQQKSRFNIAAQIYNTYLNDPNTNRIQALIGLYSPATNNPTIGNLANAIPKDFILNNPQVLQNPEAVHQIWANVAAYQFSINSNNLTSTEKENQKLIAQELAKNFELSELNGLYDRLAKGEKVQRNNLVLYLTDKQRMLSVSVVDNSPPFASGMLPKVEIFRIAFAPDPSKKTDGVTPDFEKVLFNNLHSTPSFASQKLPSQSSSDLPVIPLNKNPQIVKNGLPDFGNHLLNVQLGIDNLVPDLQQISQRNVLVVSGLAGLAKKIPLVGDGIDLLAIGMVNFIGTSALQTVTTFSPNTLAGPHAYSGGYNEAQFKQFQVQLENKEVEIIGKSGQKEKVALLSYMGTPEWEQKYPEFQADYQLFTQDFYSTQRQVTNAFTTGFNIVSFGVGGAAKNAAVSVAERAGGLKILERAGINIAKSESPFLQKAGNFLARQTENAAVSNPLKGLAFLLPDRLVSAFPLAAVITGAETITRYQTAQELCQKLDCNNPNSQYPQAKYIAKQTGLDKALEKGSEVGLQWIAIPAFTAPFLKLPFEGLSKLAGEARKGPAVLKPQEISPKTEVSPLAALDNTTAGKIDAVKLTNLQTEVSLRIERLASEGKSRGEIIADSNRFISESLKNSLKSGEIISPQELARARSAIANTFDMENITISARNYALIEQQVARDLKVSPQQLRETVLKLEEQTIDAARKNANAQEVANKYLETRLTELSVDLSQKEQWQKAIQFNDRINSAIAIGEKANNTVTVHDTFSKLLGTPGLFNIDEMNPTDLANLKTEHARLSQLRETSAKALTATERAKIDVTLEEAKNRIGQGEKKFANLSPDEFAAQVVPQAPPEITLPAPVNNPIKETVREIQQFRRDGKTIRVVEDTSAPSGPNNPTGKAYTLELSGASPELIERTKTVIQKIREFETEDLGKRLREKQLVDIIFSPDIVKKAEAGTGKTTLSRLITLLEGNTIYSGQTTTEATAFATDLMKKSGKLLTKYGTSVYLYDFQRGFLEVKLDANGAFILEKAKVVDVNVVRDTAIKASQNPTQNGIIIISDSANLGWGTAKGRTPGNAPASLLAEMVLGSGKSAFISDEIGAQIAGRFSVTDGIPVPIVKLTGFKRLLLGKANGQEILNTHNEVGNSPAFKEYAKSVYDAIRKSDSSDSRLYKIKVGDKTATRAFPKELATIGKIYAELAEQTLSKFADCSALNNNLLFAFVKPVYAASCAVREKLNDVATRLKKDPGNEELRQELVSITQSVAENSGERQILADIRLRISYVNARFDVLGRKVTNDLGAELNKEGKREIVLRKKQGTTGESYQDIPHLLALQTEGAKMLEAHNSYYNDAPLLLKFFRKPAVELKNLKSLSELTVSPNSIEITNRYLYYLIASDGRLIGFDATPDSADSLLGSLLKARDEVPNTPDLLFTAANYEALLKKAANDPAQRAFEAGKAKALDLITDQMPYDSALKKYLAYHPEIETVIITKYKTDINNPNTGAVLTEYQLQRVNRSRLRGIELKEIAPLANEGEWNNAIQQHLSADPNSLLIAYVGRNRAVDLKISDQNKSNKNIAWTHVGDYGDVAGNTIGDITQGVKRNRILARADDLRQQREDYLQRMRDSGQEPDPKLYWTDAEIAEASKYSLWVISDQTGLTPENIVSNYVSIQLENLSAQRFQSTLADIAQLQGTALENAQKLLLNDLLKGKNEAQQKEIRLKFEVLIADAKSSDLAQITQLLTKPLTAEQIPGEIYTRGQQAYQRLLLMAEVMKAEFGLNDSQLASLRNAWNIDKPYLARSEFEETFKKPVARSTDVPNGPSDLVLTWAKTNSPETLPELAFGRGAPETVKVAQTSKPASEAKPLSLPAQPLSPVGTIARIIRAPIVLWQNASTFTPASTVNTILTNMGSALQSGTILRQEIALQTRTVIQNFIDNTRDQFTNVTVPIQAIAILSKLSADLSQIDPQQDLGPQIETAFSTAQTQLAGLIKTPATLVTQSKVAEGIKSQAQSAQTLTPKEISFLKNLDEFDQYMLRVIEPHQGQRPYLRTMRTIAYNASNQDLRNITREFYPQAADLLESLAKDMDQDFLATIVQNESPESLDTVDSKFYEQAYTLFWKYINPALANNEGKIESLAELTTPRERLIVFLFIRTKLGNWYKSMMFQQRPERYWDEIRNYQFTNSTTTIESYIDRLKQSALLSFPMDPTYEELFTGRRDNRDLTDEETNLLFNNISTARRRAIAAAETNPPPPLPTNLVTDKDITLSDVNDFEANKILKSAKTVDHSSDSPNAPKIESLPKQYAPVKKTTVGGVTIYLSPIHKLEAGNLFAVGYVQTENGVYARSFTKSVSAGVWRSYSHGGYGRSWFGKGYAEEGTFLPIEIQSALNNLALKDHISDGTEENIFWGLLEDGPEKKYISKSLEIGTDLEFAKEHDEPKPLPGHFSKWRINFITTDSVTNPKTNNTGFNHVVEVDVDSINPTEGYLVRLVKEQNKWIETSPKGSNIKKIVLVYPDPSSWVWDDVNKAPSNEVYSVAFKSDACPAINCPGTTYIIYSKDKTIRYYFVQEEKTSTVALQGWEDLTQPITSFGLRKGFYSQEWMATPLYEYSDQLPEEFLELSERSIGSNGKTYFSSGKFLSGLPTHIAAIQAIERYKEQIALAELRQSNLTNPPLSLPTKLEAEIVKPDQKLLEQTPIERRYLVNDQWTRALALMDSIDNKIKKETSGYPHLQIIESMVYHRKQGLPFPDPNTDGRRQLVEAISWIHRLGQAISPVKLLELPLVNDAQSNQITDDFLKNNDPTWSKTTLDIAELLEPIVLGADLQLYYSLTDENYEKLDTDQKKLIAFILLRDRVSDMAAGIVNTFTARLDINTMPDFYDFDTLYNAAVAGNSIDAARKKLLAEPMGAEKTVLDWIRQVMDDPLLTNTKEVYFYGKNHIREQFVEQVATADKKIDEQIKDAPARGRLKEIRDQRPALFQDPNIKIAILYEIKQGFSQLRAIVILDQDNKIKAIYSGLDPGGFVLRQDEALSLRDFDILKRNATPRDIVNAIANAGVKVTTPIEQPKVAAALPPQQGPTLLQPVSADKPLPFAVLQTQTPASFDSNVINNAQTARILTQAVAKNTNLDDKKQLTARQMALNVLITQLKDYYAKLQEIYNKQCQSVKNNNIFSPVSLAFAQGTGNCLTSQQIAKGIDELIAKYGDKDSFQALLNQEAVTNGFALNELNTLTLAQTASEIFLTQAQLAKDQTIVLLAWNRAKQTTSYAKIPLLGDMLLYLREFNKPLAKIVAEELAPSPTVRVFAHRAGFLETVISLGEVKTQNSIPRAKDSLTIVDGVELDLRFTSDGIAVITHDDVRKMSFEEFKEKNPSHDTLETWVEWFKQKGMEEKEIYLDLKGTEQDPYKLLQLVSDLGNRVSIGSRDKKTVFKLLLARKILGLKTKIYLQIPDPIFNPFNPSGVLSDAENLGKTVGLEAKVNHADTEEQEIYNLKADGVHFFWPENLWSAIWSEIQNNGRRVPVTDQSKIPGKIAVFPNIPLFANLQKARLETFVKTAKRLGYEVIGGSTASPAIMQMMIDWGVNTIMPNDPTLLPGFLKRDDSPQNIPDPKGRFLNTRTDLKEGNIVSEKTESDPLRTKYLKFASRLGSQQPVVFQKPAGLSGTNTNSPQPETLVFTEVSVNTDRQLPVPDNATLKVNDTIIEVRNVTILQVVASNEVNQVLPISAPNQPLSNYYFLEKDQTYQFIDNTSGEVLAEAAIGQTPILIASAFYQGNVFDQTISFARLFLYLTNLYLLNPIRHLYQPLQKSIVTAAQHFLQNHSKTNDFIVKAIMKIRDLLAGTIRLTRNIIRNVLPAWSDGLGRILITLDQGRTLPAIKNTAPPKHLPEREPSINAQKPADLISLPLFSTAGLNETDIENLNKVLPQIRTIAQDLYDKTLKALTKHNVLLEYDTKLTRLNVSQTLDTLSWAVVADKNQVKKFNPYLRLLISNLINTPGSGLQDKISPEALAEIAENAILNTLEQISQLAKQNNNVVTLKPLDLSPLANISALNTNAVLKENNGKNEFDLTKFDPIDKNKPFGLINPLTGKNVGRVLFVSKPSYRPGLIIFEDNSLRLFIAKPAQRYGYVQLTSDNSPGSEITMANIFSDLLTQNLWHNSGLVIPPSQIALLGLKSSADQGPSINENYIITPFLDNTLVLSDVENIQTQITSENKNARTALLALSLAFGNWDLKPADIFADRQNKNQIKALDFENTILNFLENGGAGGIPKDDPGIGEKVDIVNQNPIFHLLYLIENDPEYKYIFAEFKNIFADLTIADLKPFLDSLKTYLSNPYHLQALLEKNGYAKEQATRSIARLTHYVKNLEQNTGVLLDYLTGKIGFIDAASALVETTKPLLVNLFNDAIGYPKLSTDETIGPTKPISLALLQKFAARSAIDKNLTLVADEQEIVNEIAAAVKNTTSLSRLEQEIAARTAVKILAENFLEFLTQVDPTDKKYQEVQNLNEEIKRLIPIFSKKEAIQGRLAGELRKNYSLKPDDAYLAAISEVMSGIFTKQAELIRQQAIVVLAWNRAKQTNRLARLPIIGNLLLYLQSFNKPLAQLVSEQLAFSQKPADLPERPAGPNPGATLQRVFPVDTSALPALQVIHLETQNRLKLLARLLNADSKLRFLDPKTRGKGMNQDPFLKFIAKEDYNFLALFDGDRVLGFALYQTYTNGRISIRRVFLNPNENQSQAAIVFKLIHFFQNNNLIKKIYLSDEPIRSPSLNAIYSELGFADNLWQREPIVPSPTTSISLTPFWRFADSVSIFVNNAFGIVSGSTPVASNKGDHFEVTFSEHNRIVAKSLKGQGDKKTTLTIQEGDLIYPQDFPFEYQKAVSPGKFFYLNPNKVFILERNGQKYEILLNEPIPTVNKFVELGTRAILGITTLTAGILGTYWYARFQIDITLPNFFNALPPGWRSKIVLGILTFYLNLINILPYTAQIQYSLQLDNYRNYLETKVNPELSKYGYKMVLEPQGESQAGQPGSTPLLVTKVVPLATNPPSSTVNDKLFNEGLPSAKSGSTQPQIPANTKEPVIVQNVQSPPPKPKSEAPAIPLGNQQAIVSRQNNQQNVVSQPKQIINSQNIALKTVTGGNLFSYKNSTHFSYTSIRWSDPERSYGDYVGSWEQLAGNPEFGWFDRDGIFHNYKREEVKGQDGKNYSGYVVAERSGKPGYIESISLPYDKSDVAISDLEALLDSSKRELKEWGNAGDLKNIMIVIDGKVVFNDTVKKLIQGNNSAPYLKLFGRRYDQMGALVSTYPWVYKDNFKIIVYGDTQPRYFDVQGVEFENDDSNSIVPSTGSTNDFPSNLESQYETQTISPEKVVDKNGFAKSENLSVGVNKPAVLSFSGQRTLNSIQISLPKQFADSYPDSLMMEISNDGKVVFEMPVSEFFGEPGRLSLYHSSPIGIMPDPANPNNYLLYSNIPMVFNNLKITFKVSDKTPNVNFNFKYDLQPVTHDGTLEVITKKIHVRAGEPDMSIDITDDGLIVGMVIAGHNNTINPNDPKQIDPNSKPSPQKPWGTNFIEGNVIVRSNTQVGQNSKIVYAADGWEALPGCGFGCGPQGLSKPAGYSNTPAYLPTAGLLSADAYNPHPSATFFNYGLNISFQNGGRINIGHGNYKNNSELDIWVKVFIIRPPKPKSEAPIIQSITELKNVSQSQTNATPITDLLKLVPDSFMGEMIKPFVADTLRQREERRKNDPNWTKRVDQSLNAERINFLLFGSGWNYEPPDFTKPGITHGSYTIVSYNLKTGKVDLISISNDFGSPEVALAKKLGPDVLNPTTRISEAYATGGFDLMRQAVEDATGFSIDFQLVFEDDMIAKFIDNVFGKIEVDVPFDVKTYPYYFNQQLQVGLEFKKGRQSMDGKTVLGYIKANAQGDYDKRTERSARKQAFTKAVKEEMAKKIVLEQTGFVSKLSKFLVEVLNKKGANYDFEQKLITIDNLKILTSLLGHLTNVGFPQIDNTITLADEYSGDGGGVRNVSGDMYLPRNANPKGDLVNDYWRELRNFVKSKLISPVSQLPSQNSTSQKTSAFAGGGTVSSPLEGLINAFLTIMKTLNHIFGNQVLNLVNNLVYSGALPEGNLLQRTLTFEKIIDEVTNKEGKERDYYINFAILPWVLANGGEIYYKIEKNYTLAAALMRHYLYGNGKDFDITDLYKQTIVKLYRRDGLQFDIFNDQFNIQLTNEKDDNQVFLDYLRQSFHPDLGGNSQKGMVRVFSKSPLPPTDKNNASFHIQIRRLAGPGDFGENKKDSYYELGNSLNAYGMDIEGDVTSVTINTKDPRLVDLVFQNAKYSIIDFYDWDPNVMSVGGGYFGLLSRELIRVLANHGIDLNHYPWLKPLVEKFFDKITEKTPILLTNAQASSLGEYFLADPFKIRAEYTLPTGFTISMDKTTFEAPINKNIKPKEDLDYGYYRDVILITWPDGGNGSVSSPKELEEWLSDSPGETFKVTNYFKNEIVVFGVKIPPGKTVEITIPSQPQNLAPSQNPAPAAKSVSGLQRPIIPGEKTTGATGIAATIIGSPLKGMDLVSQTLLNIAQKTGFTPGQPITNPFEQFKKAIFDILVWESETVGGWARGWMDFLVEQKQLPEGNPLQRILVFHKIETEVVKRNGVDRENYIKDVAWPWLKINALDY